MLRVEENEKMISLLGEVGEDTAVLIDISKSLALIADCCLDKWQKDQIDRFMSMTQEDKKIISDYLKLDESAIINCFMNAIPKQKIHIKESEKDVT